MKKFLNINTLIYINRKMVRIEINRTGVYGTADKRLQLIKQHTIRHNFSTQQQIRGCKM